MLSLLWNSTRGYRLTPWKSPYLRWRIETYSGIPAEMLTRDTFFRFIWAERKSLFEYLRWVQRMAKR